VSNIMYLPSAISLRKLEQVNPPRPRPVKHKVAPKHLPKVTPDLTFPGHSLHWQLVSQISILFSLNRIHPRLSDGTTPSGVRKQDKARHQARDAAVQVGGYLLDEGTIGTNGESPVYILTGMLLMLRQTAT
jgi:hypothetical protein